MQTSYVPCREIQLVVLFPYVRRFFFFGSELQILRRASNLEDQEVVCSGYYFLAEGLRFWGFVYSSCTWSILGPTFQISGYIR